MPFLIVLSETFRWRLRIEKLEMDKNTSNDNDTIIRLMQDVGLGMDTPICQYMNLDFLIALLKTGEYYVNKKIIYRDKREKSLPCKLVFSEFTIPDGQISPDQIERSKMRHETIRQFENVSPYLLTSCWTERVSENALMWDRDGVKHKACIKSTIGRFASAISCSELIIWCGKMIYEPIFPVLMSDDIIWYKQPYFSDEREIRFYFSKEIHRVTPDDGILNHRSFPVDRQNLIQEIVLSPYIEKSDAERLKENFEKEYNIPTTISKIEIS